VMEIAILKQAQCGRPTLRQMQDEQPRSYQPARCYAPATS
jgi:hypothetical protein